MGRRVNESRLNTDEARKYVHNFDFFLKKSTAEWPAMCALGMEYDLNPAPKTRRRLSRDFNVIIPE